MTNLWEDSFTFFAYKAQHTSNCNVDGHSYVDIDILWLYHKEHRSSMVQRYGVGQAVLIGQGVKAERVANIGYPVTLVSVDWCPIEVVLAL